MNKVSIQFLDVIMYLHSTKLNLVCLSLKYLVMSYTGLIPQESVLLNTGLYMSKGYINKEVKCDQSRLSKC